MQHKTLFLCLAALLPLATAAGQTKYEREYRIKTQAVPAPARQFVDSLAFRKKVKWYFEENLRGNSIEAKVCRDKKRFSIEFDTSGVLQDIEIQHRWTDIPEHTRNQITATLDSLFVRHDIRKIQIQYAGDRSALFKLAQNQQPAKAYTTRYEMVVKGKKPDGLRLYEITLDENGALRALEEIVFKNSDNLEY
ncbi:MAG: hypothetical protein R3D58_15260 [Saprospiraceae bacterium]